MCIRTILRRPGFARRRARRRTPLARRRARSGRVSLVRGVATNVHAIREMPMDVPGSAKAKLLHEAYAAAKSVSPLIAQVSAQVMDRETDVIIANSEGLMVADKRVYSRMGINAVASENGENQTGFIGPGAQRGFEFFREGIDPEAAARSAAQTALTMLRAEHCPAGTMPVIIDGGFGGVIFHEACGHSLEAHQRGLWQFGIQRQAGREDRQRLRDGHRRRHDSRRVGLHQHRR